MKFSRISDLERKYVNETLDAQFRTHAGSVMMSRLEKAFAEKFGTKYAISFINGTATMHAALAAKGIGPGDEVIVPPLTMASTTFAVMHAGAMPVFADIDADTWNIDPKLVEERITERTKAIIPVGIFGLPVDIDPLMKLAKEHDLFVLEDNAQCVLSEYNGRIAGTVGHCASYSFQSSKHLASGEGGMIITDDDDLALNIRRFNSLGYAGVGATKGKITKDTIQDPDYDRHASLGFNYRIPELCAAVALAQVERAEELVGMRILIAGMHEKARGDCSWLTPQFTPEGFTNSYWAYVVKLDTEKIPWREFRSKYMELGGDGVYACWKLTHLEPMLLNEKSNVWRYYRKEDMPQEYGPGLCPVAERTAPKLLQFKTNYTDMETAQRKADILTETIDYFGG